MTNPIPPFVPGFRLIDGSDLNNLVTPLNDALGLGNSTAQNGTFASVTTGCLTATKLAPMPSIPLDTVAAAGGNISTAAALSTGVNLVTGADGAKGVVLPAGSSASGQSSVVVVIDTVDAALKLYPPVGGTIDGGAGNASLTMGNLTSAFCFSGNATAWYTVPTTPA